MDNKENAWFRQIFDLDIFFVASGMIICLLYACHKAF